MDTPTSGVRRSRVWQAVGFLSVLLAAAGVLAAAASLAGFGSRHKGPLMDWQAFYLPDQPAILIHVNQGPCSATVAVKEHPQTIEVTAREAAGRPGYGSCEAFISGSVRQLHHDVGSRAIRAPAGSTGQAFDLSTRLHQPVTGTDGMPFGAQVVHTAAGDQWTLAYGRLAPDTTYVLVSVPDDHRHSALTTTVRGQRRVTPCAGTLCWREHGILYSIEPSGDPTITAAQAAALAATLV